MDKSSDPIIGVGGPVWNIEELQKPENERVVLDCMKYFAYFAQQDDQSVEHFKDVFHKIKISSNLKEEATAIQYQLTQKYPDLFPAKIPITVGEKLVFVDQNKLAALSPKYAAVTTGSWKESSINLSKIMERDLGKGHTSEVMQQFVEYLENGDIDINHENIAELVDIASEYNFTDLLKKSEAFLKDVVETPSADIDIEDILGVVTGLALRYDLLNLKFSLLELMTHIEKGTDNTQGASQVDNYIATLKDENHKYFLECAFSVLKKGVSAESWKNTLVFRREPCFSADVLNELKILKTKYGILPESIQIGSTSKENIETLHITDDELGSLCLLYPKIEKLSLISLDVATIPQSWLSTLKEIICESCSNIKSIDLPKAVSVHCTSCPKLERLSMPKADVVQCVEVPMTSLIAPEATCIFIERLLECKELIAPKLTLYLSINQAPFQDLLLPHVGDLDCFTCPNLKTINAPKAQMLRLVNNPVLEDVSAPEARDLAIDQCSQVRTVHAAKATNFRCNSSRLTSLQLLNALQVVINDSTCTFLYAPKAMTLDYHRDWSSLTDAERQNIRITVAQGCKIEGLPPDITVTYIEQPNVIDTKTS